MRFRLSIVLLLVLVLVLSACGATSTPKASAIPDMPPPDAVSPSEDDEPGDQEGSAPAAEAGDEGDSSEAAEPVGEAPESSDTGPLPIVECLASPDMYTWTHTMVSKDEGSRGWKCQGKLIVSNTSGQTLLIDPHLDVSAGTSSSDPWVEGEVTSGEQYHDWHHQQVLAPGATYEFDSSFTAYDDGTYTYRQITRILLRRDLAGCLWFTPLDAEAAASSTAESSVDIPNPCLGTTSTDGG